MAGIAEARNHHPDIDIRCSTHSQGGITGLDVELAREIDRVLADAMS